MTQTARRKGDRLVMTTIRIPQSDMEQLRALAKDNHRTLSQEIRHLVSLYIQTRSDVGTGLPQ